MSLKNTEYLIQSSLGDLSGEFVSDKEIGFEVECGYSELQNIVNYISYEKSLSPEMYTSGDTKNISFQQILPSKNSEPPSRIKNRYSPLSRQEFAGIRPQDIDFPVVKILKSEYAYPFFDFKITHVDDLGLREFVLGLDNSTQQINFNFDHQEQINDNYNEQSAPYFDNALELKNNITQFNNNNTINQQDVTNYQVVHMQEDYRPIYIDNSNTINNNNLDDQKQNDYINQKNHTSYNNYEQDNISTLRAEKRIRDKITKELVQVIEIQQEEQAKDSIRSNSHNFTKNNDRGDQIIARSNNLPSPDYQVRQADSHSPPSVVNEFLVKRKIIKEVEEKTNEKIENVKRETHDDNKKNMQKFMRKLMNS